MTKEGRGGKRKGAGRPKSDDPATVQVQVRTTPLGRAIWEDAAESAGKTLSEWMRDVCNTAAQRTNRSTTR